MRRSEIVSAALEEAAAMLGSGNAAGAERIAKAVSAMARAEQDVAALMAARTPVQEEDEEAVLAELRSRFAKFAEADIAGAPPEILERIAATGIAE